MRITQISLTNFRSFKETQVFDLAPVTLMFGPNSAGKSSIFSALFYVQQILEKGQCNPMYLDALGKKYIGGFKNLVHKRDLDTTIKIKIKFDLGSSNVRSYSYLYPLIESELNIKLNSPVKEVKSMTAEFEIAWSKIKNDAYIKNYLIDFDDIGMADIHCDENLEPSITMLNYIHPLLWPKNHDNWLKEQETSRSAVHTYNQLEIYQIDNHSGEELASDSEFFGLKSLESFNFLEKKMVLDEELSKVHYKEIYGDEDFDADKYAEYASQIIKDKLSQLSFNISSDNYYVSSLHKLIHSKKWSENNFFTLIHKHRYAEQENEYRFLHKPISLLQSNSGLPLLGRKINTSLDIVNIKEREIVSELLSDVLVAPLDYLLGILNKSISIGPIRKIIDANYQPLPYIEQKDWFDGSAAWSYLEKADLDTLKKIHTWMSDEDKLNLGYGIALKEVQSTVKTFNINNTSSKIDADNRLEVKVHDKSDFISSNESNEDKTYRYTIIDKFNQIPVTPSEVGTGVSQLMPLIIAAISQQGGIVACEQPELHLHPRIQVAIADLLTQNIDNVSYLIETHSEHLILRLLKRIRQHTDNELPEGLDFIKKSDVAIIYLEPTENGVIANTIGITEDGEFTDNWPHGFFSERRQELM